MLVCWRANPMIFRQNPRIFPLNPMKSIYTIGFPMCNSPSNEFSRAIVKGAPWKPRRCCLTGSDSAWILEKCPVHWDIGGQHAINFDYLSIYLSVCLSIYLSINPIQSNLIWSNLSIHIPVVPHKAVAEVSRIGHYRRGELLWCMDGRANPLMDRKVVGVVFFGVVGMVAVVTSPTTAGCSVV